MTILIFVFRITVIDIFLMIKQQNTDKSDNDRDDSINLVIIFRDDHRNDESDSNDLAIVFFANQNRETRIDSVNFPSL